MRMNTVIKKTSFYCGECGRELRPISVTTLGEDNKPITEVESCVHPAPIEFGREVHTGGMIYPEKMEIAFEDGKVLTYGILGCNVPSIK